MNGLVIDLFAGGGGASSGIEVALGRKVDIAINHSQVALDVHAANHPGTEHLTANLFEVKPIEATGGRPVDLLWASPDCTHFSLAKGGKPRQQGIRSLAWVVTRWAKDVQPDVIFLENVAEFQGWGPLDDEGYPIKALKGVTFKRWLRRLRKLGYEVDYRVLDASLFGAPTRRRRLFLIARRDGQPIEWPVPTHGRPGRLPLHTAAECIDWSLSCPSIFERKKPLADKTLWRIAQGLRRFVLESAKPFVVRYNSRPTFRGRGLDEPLTTVTATQRGHALVTPIVTRTGQTGGNGNYAASADQPLGVVVTKADQILVAPTLIQTGYGERHDAWRCGDCGFLYERADLPTCGCTKCGSEADPVLIAGQRPRYLNLHEPLGTVMADGQKHALVSAFVAKHFGDTGQRPGLDVGAEPMATITASDHHALAAATLIKLRGECSGADLEEPMPTLTAGGGRGGGHLAEVRAFLTAYYGEDGTSGQDLLEPLRTITAKQRLGLVTVEGTEYQIVDIAMRMLEPHELLRAQFGEYAAGYDLSAARTKAAKVRLIGNSVCPEIAEALVRSNVNAAAEQRRTA